LSSSQKTLWSQHFAPVWELMPALIPTGVGSAPEITGDTAFAVPGVGEARLSLVNRGSADITVTLDGRDVVVPAGNFVTRPVGVGSHTLSSLQPFFAAVSLRAETAIESFMVLPTPAPQGSVMVSVR